MRKKVRADTDVIAREIVEDLQDELAQLQEIAEDLGKGRVIKQ